eukprot:jgi/Mesvir1/24460/Mv21825-RA.5
MDEVALESCSRRELQRLAKKSGVKANGKNAEIIEQLRALEAASPAATAPTSSLPDDLPPDGIMSPRTMAPAAQQWHARTEDQLNALAQSMEVMKRLDALSAMRAKMAAMENELKRSARQTLEQSLPAWQQRMATMEQDLKRISQPLNPADPAALASSSGPKSSSTAASSYRATTSSTGGLAAASASAAGAPSAGSAGAPKQRTLITRRRSMTATDAGRTMTPMRPPMKSVSGRITSPKDAALVDDIHDDFDFAKEAESLAASVLKSSRVRKPGEGAPSGAEAPAPKSLAHAQLTHLQAGHPERSMSVGAMPMPPMPSSIKPPSVTSGAAAPAATGGAPAAAAAAYPPNLSIHTSAASGVPKHRPRSAHRPATEASSAAPHEAPVGAPPCQDEVPKRRVSSSHGSNSTRDASTAGWEGDSGNEAAPHPRVRPQSERAGGSEVVRARAAQPALAPNDPMASPRGYPVQPGSTSKMGFVDRTFRTRPSLSPASLAEGANAAAAWAASPGGLARTSSGSDVLANAKLSPDSISSDGPSSSSSTSAKVGGMIPMHLLV